MIISRTPFRVSFVGGGSDVRWFYERNGYGQVLSSAIRHYMYIVIHPYFHPRFLTGKIRLKYSEIEDVGSHDDVSHSIFRACLKRLEVPTGIEIASFADIPAGTGLGSSSTFTVGLLHALHAWKGQVVTKDQLAHETAEIEIDVLEKPIGKQDQYAAACGGLNVIRFHADESVSVDPVYLSNDARTSLEARLRLYYLGSDRTADRILKHQNAPTDRDRKFEQLKRMADQVPTLKAAIETGRLDTVGPLLDEGWQIKKALTAGVSTRAIDDVYEKALSLGARGGKLLGAVGTGFLLLDASDHRPLEEHLGLVSVPFEIDRDGSRILS